MACNCRRVEDTAGAADYTAWDCDGCGKEVRRYRGTSDVDYNNCGACYSASGQWLRDDWRGNRSNYDDTISDMDGYEIQNTDR